MKTVRTQKSYPGEYPRPSTEIIVHENEKILIAATPWGTQDALKTLSDTIKEFLSASLGDREATSPFATLPGLSVAENNLRSATLLGNDSVYQRCNKEFFNSSCEALIFHFHGTEVAWTQIGQPHLLLIRAGKLYPIQMSLDLTVDYKNPTPLPSRLIGLEKANDFEIRSLALSDEDQLILLARSYLPPAFFSQSFINLGDEKIISQLFNVAVDDDPKAPFWIALIK